MQNTDKINVFFQKNIGTSSLSTKNRPRNFLEKNYTSEDVVLMELEKFRTMLRIDKSFAYHLSEINFPKHCDKTIFVELIFFMSCRHKLNLFNSTEFTLQDFAHQFRYTVDYLQKTHPAIKEGKLKPIVDDDKVVYKSIFDVTIHQLLNTFFKIDTVTNEPDGTRTSEKLRYFIIEYLRIKENARLNKKRTYLITLSRAFVENLAKNYQNIDFVDYVKICSGDGTNKGRDILSQLYVHLSYWQQRLGVLEPFTPQFEELCNIAGIQAIRPAKRKETLAKALEKLSKSTFIPFEYYFVKTKKQRYSYSVLINFLHEPVEEPEKARLLFDILKKESMFLYLALCPKAQDTVMDEKEKYHEFELWRTDASKNPIEKQNLLNDLANKIKKNSDPIDRGIIDSISNHFFEQIISIN